MPPTQSLTTPTAAVANATGEATFKWQGVPIGTNWVVAALVPLAPAAAVLTINENTSPVMSWIGASPSSTIEFAGGAIVSVSATGLTPGLTYRAMVRGQQYQGPALGLAPSTLASFTQAFITASTSTVSINNYLPTLGTKLLSVQVTLLGLSTAVQLPAFDLFLGVSLGWTPTNSGKHIYSLGAPSVSVTSASINTSVPVLGWQVANANEIWVLGTTGDIVNVTGE